jgi:transcriptional regulator with XRE-family HTH domain
MAKRDTERELREAVGAWLKRLPELTGQTLTGIAREIGVSTSTLTKPANNPDHPHVMSFSTIAKIARRYHIPPPSGMGDELAALLPGFAADEASPFKFDGPPDFNALIKAYIADRPGIDPWRLNARALELAGYVPGDVMIVDLNAAPRTRDVVVAQVFDHEMSRTETVWRLYERPYLVAATTDPSLLRPIHEDAAAIKGVVLVSFRARPVSRGT